MIVSVTETSRQDGSTTFIVDTESLPNCLYKEAILRAVASKNKCDELSGYADNGDIKPAKRKLPITVEAAVTIYIEW